MITDPLPRDETEVLNLSLLRPTIGVHEAKRIARGNRMVREIEKIEDENLRAILAEIIRTVWRI